MLKLPEASTPSLARARRFEPSVIEGNLGRVRAPVEEEFRGMVTIPVMGRIAAGTPISALQSRSHTVGLPPDMLPAGEHYALEGSWPASSIPTR